MGTSTLATKSRRTWRDRAVLPLGASFALVLGVGVLRGHDVAGAGTTEDARSASDADVRDVCIERVPALAQASTRRELVFALVRAGDADAVETLLDCGVDVEDTDGSGRTALHLASYHGHAALVSLLLARGADPSAVDAMGLTPLMNAAFRGEDGIVRSLLDAGAPVDATNAAGQSAVMFAAAFARHTTVDLLVARGASLDRADRLGFTARSFATVAQPAESIERFVRAAVREARALAETLGS